MSKEKEFLLEYFNDINGKPKTEDVLDKYISDPELKEHIRFFEHAFPEYEIIPEEMIQEENKIAVRATVRGKHLGELMGIPATNKDFIISIMLIYEIENGKVSKHWMVADQFALMQQLGVIN